MEGVEGDVEVSSSKDEEAGPKRTKESRGKLALFSDREGVGHVRMVGSSKELI